ncbi:S-adenosyl-L-methionine-dependent methyltransferase [Phaeosphaeriaceae sp. PMI808]|nr:S-adenosyl-L-methionine-dependent methyltransferase [Phaeosphaeriaceae sp. PMI808]
MAAIHEGQRNERTFHDTESAYLLPNDKPEHSRLEGQAKHFRALMNDQIIHAPLNAPLVRKGLDIGCGTGIVTHDIAFKFPNAQVYGLDISPVPMVREKLANIEYIQADFDHLATPDSTDPRFQEASFDYIFSRLLILGVTDWKDYVSRCIALVKPGGWIEMHEFDNSMCRVPNPINTTVRASLHPHSLGISNGQLDPHPADQLSAPFGWMKTWDKLGASQGIDITCGRQLPRLFVEAGLTEVSVTRYLYPISSFEGLTDVEKRFAVFHHETMGAYFPDVIRKVGQGQDEQEVEKAAEEARKENEGWRKNRGFVWFYVICGRKLKEQ